MSNVGYYTWFSANIAYATFGHIARLGGVDFYEPKAHIVLPYILTIEDVLWLTDRAVEVHIKQTDCGVQHINCAEGVQIFEYHFPLTNML
jgi:hypothetical protein